ncbi:hypothetical protein [Alicyclobacillus acidoterrestris]|uniref:Uncharacterized protein n=1 Tax=Alicyclobacillus acidoterrestris (strain ATCC 49025 / DSM 3922 / CIP 106132 / NCIMB 13137 / GD3B) TaxID=1356854 RepID=T0D4I0_ALIAG|nr:hypothetical protein [Alicyclobacillus acidoterrestris]EPZ44641.1 hypothetical protein N007_10405 [Alicyclobacillus acidoterrestris ATCC 49025]UNO50344.1 hypothetical protein K1I37_07680 [Alicyclobacillus acidoterrestris]
MTTRFSLAELADMLHVPVEAVRQAVESLVDELTGESFLYNDRTWRIAPSDVKRIQLWLEVHPEVVEEARRSRTRRVRVKRIVAPGEGSE